VVVIDAGYTLSAVAVGCTDPGAAALAVLSAWCTTDAAGADTLADTVHVALALGGLLAEMLGHVTYLSAGTGLGWTPGPAASDDAGSAWVAIGHEVAAITFDAHPGSHMAGPQAGAVAVGAAALSAQAVHTDALT